jgi:aminoglycoside 3-N-acetyltransferase
LTPDGRPATREADLVAASPSPVTVESLSGDLRALGVERGQTVIVHTALSALGWVCGGAPAVVLALQAVVGDEGTVVMPTHTNDLSDPAGWENPPVPESWCDTIRAAMPAYRPDLTPSRRLGAVPDCFRAAAGVRRSAHPHYSFAAWGAGAEEVTVGHALDDGLGERSPLARVYDRAGWVLLLGVDHGGDTSLHLAEYRAGVCARVTVGAPVLVDGERRWVEFADVALDESDFAALGEEFAAATGLERRGHAGHGEARLAPQRELVDFAVDWLRAHRPAPVS